MCWLLVSCLDKTVTKLQYMPDMADAPTVKTQEEYLDPPVGSVPRDAVLYAAQPEESTLAMPLEITDDTLSEGKHLYGIFCAVCHGAGGKGDGGIVEDFPRPPDITAAVYRKQSDGYIFHRVTFGTGIMPGYGHATSRNERWKIIKYLRSLQSLEAVKK